MTRLSRYMDPASKTIRSTFSGDLKIAWYKGKKHLNSKHANYSYGALQRVLKYGLEKIDLSKVNSILVLGMGGGSVIETLRQDFNYIKPITAVEIDPVIINIAKTEFGITENETLNIHCTDAYNFVTTNDTLFDLIIVDLYIDLNVPEQFLSLAFWDRVLKSKSSKGAVIFNASVGTNSSPLHLDHVISFLRSKVFKISVFEKVNDTNTIIVASGL